MKIDYSYLDQIGIDVKDLMFAITLKCNRRCLHCYIGNEWLDSDLSFTKSDALGILDCFGSRGLSRLTFLGGEPLLYEHVSDLILKSQAYGKIEKRISTNGMSPGCLDLTRIKPHHLDHISISFEGYTAKLHDAIRGAGAFISAVKTLNVFLALGFEVKVTYTVTAHNLSSVPQAIRFFRDLDIHEININTVGMIGNAAEHPGLAVRPEDCMRLYQRLLKLTGVTEMRLRVSPKYFRKEMLGELNPRYRDLMEGDYSPPENGHRVVLYPNGKVYVFSDLTCRYYHVAIFKEGAILPNPSSRDLEKWGKLISLSSPITKLQEMEIEGYIPLPASYKEYIQY